MAQQTKTVIGVLAEIMCWIDHDAIPPHTNGDRALRGSGHLGDDVVDHPPLRDPVVHPERTSPRHRAAGVRAHQSGAELRGDRREVRIGSAPGVVDQVRSGGTGLFGHLGSPGVNADQLVGEGVAEPLDEGHDTGYLLDDVHAAARTRLDATDVDDVGSLADDPVRCLLGSLVGERCTAVVERVRRAVHDRHDQRSIPGHRSPKKRRLHAPRLRACGFGAL